MDLHANSLRRAMIISIAVALGAGAILCIIRVSSSLVAGMAGALPFCGFITS